MADGRLNSVYEFIFKGEDKVSPVVKTIDGQIDSTVRRARRFKEEIGGLADDASSKLENLASVSESVKDSFSELSKTNSSESLTKAIKSVDDYTKALDTEYESLKKLKDVLSSNGQDTQYIEVAMRALEQEGDSLAKTVGELYNTHFKALIEAYNNAADSSEKAALKQQLYNDVISAFGEGTEEAKKIYEGFVSELQESESGIGKLSSKFQSFFESISKWTKGPSVLGGLVGGLVGAVTSIGLNVALQAVTKLLQKGIQSLTKWVKSWGEVKRAANQGAGAAVTATMSEVQELDRLNNKLKSTDRNTKEYATTKDELVSKFGKYYEIGRASCRERV